MNFKTLSTVCRRRILKPLSAVLLGLAALWCTGAVHYTIWAGIGPVIFLLLAAALLTLGFRNRNYWYGLTGLELAVIVWFAALTPERQFRDTKWQRPWGRMPQTAFNGTLAAVRDIRDFKYRTPEDYDIHYIDGTYDIDQVRTVDVAVSHWDGMEKIAHTMLSFGFADGRYLALSMETRLPEGKEQGFLPGFYKQYEIIMCWPPRRTFSSCAPTTGAKSFISTAPTRRPNRPGRCSGCCWKAPTGCTGSRPTTTASRRTAPPVSHRCCG